jgi:DNA repair photolyase
MYKNDFNKLEKELLGDCCLDFNSNKKLGKKVDIIRLGKRTESWTPFNHEDFLKTLEICAKVGTRCIIPTKLMPFDKDIAELVRKTKSVILYSTNANEKITKLEKGMVAYGSTPEWRIEQAFKYHEEKINSAVYLLIIAHQPPTQKEIQILEQTNYGRKIPIQLLPLRIKKEISNIFLDKKTIIYSTEREQVSIDIKNNSEHPIYIKEGKFSKTFIPKTINPFWLNLVKNNNGRIRICHHDDELIYCGGCFQKQGCIKNREK